MTLTETELARELAAFMDATGIQYLDDADPIKRARDVMWGIEIITRPLIAVIDNQTKEIEGLRAEVARLKAENTPLSEQDLDALRPLIEEAHRQAMEEVSK